MFILTIVAKLLDVILSIIIGLVLAQVIASWLIAFGVVNTRNRAVYTIIDFLNRATEPLLRPIRRFIPPLGGMDISPLILWLFIIYVIRPILHHYLPIDYL